MFWTAKVLLIDQVALGDEEALGDEYVFEIEGFLLAEKGFDC